MTTTSSVMAERIWQSDRGCDIRSPNRRPPLSLFAAEFRQPKFRRKSSASRIRDAL